MASDETTPLRMSEPDRSYVYMSARNRAYRSKIRQFQCCVCAGLLGTFVIALVITVSYMVNHDTEDEVNATDTTPPDLKLKQAIYQPEVQKLFTASWPLPDMKEVEAPSFSPTEVDDALQVGIMSLGTRDELEKEHPPIVLAPTHPSSLHRKAMYSGPESNQASRVGNVLLGATKNIYKSKSGKWQGRGPQLPPSSWMSTKWCPPKDFTPVCNPSPFRTIDGSCNNLKNPQYGVALRPFRRALPADYADGISAPRKAKNGGSLPSAREVSLTVHRPMYSNDPHFTVVLAVWGQFVDHDFTATALSQRKDGSAITCCNNGWQHPECFPLHLSKADPFYTSYNITCMDFVRSAPAPTCSLGPREQLNQVSAYIDGSVVYGGHSELAAELREFQGGRLASSRTYDGRELLPADKKPGDGCNQAAEMARGRYCFKSGDARGNENTHLTTLHLILQRQHNHLADQLHQLNPSWDDERIYQEARRIVSAQIQHITYNEFLPIVIGQDLSDQLELTPQDSEYYKGYDDSVNSQIANEFAASAFRFGHTLLQGLNKFIYNDTSSEDYVQLHKMLFNPFGLYDSGYMDKAMRGALQTDIQKPGPHFTKEVSENLFKPKAGPCGLDLVSLNVQRGRDHGLPGYPAWRERCGFSRPKTFEDLEPIMDSDTVARMKSMYDSVDDIDMYTGVVSESPMKDSGILGPTATCIITDQFVRMKKGDRFWYETPEQPQAFSPEQLNELRKTTLSSLVCDNTDALEKIQPYSMRSVTPDNPVTKCEYLPKPDLSAWIETPRVQLGASVEIKPRLMHKYPTAEEQYHFSRFLGTHISKSDMKSSEMLILGASVVSGTITGSYSAGPLVNLWDGGFPSAIPVSFLDNSKTETMTKLPGPTSMKIEKRGGILWGGSIHITSDNTIKLTANYHLPLKVHSNGSVENNWWSGEADLDLIVRWNTTEIKALAEANYFSPIMFENAHTRSGSKKSKLRSQLEGEIGINMLRATVNRPPLDPNTVPHVNIMLLGNYSVDNKIFYWNGNCTLSIPVNNYPKNNLLQTQGSKLSNNVVFGGVVKKSIVSDIEGNVQWDGTGPLKISIPKLLSTPQSLHGTTTMISAIFDVSTAGSITIKSRFSVPVNDNEGLGSLTWVGGNLEATVELIWNSSNIDTLPQDYTTMFCVVVFRNSKQLKPIINGNVDTLGDIFDMSQKPAIIAPQVILVLDGQFTDKSTFDWDGTVAVIISPKKSSVQKKLQMTKTENKSWSPRTKSNRLVLGATVVSGTITGSYSAGPLLTLWSGGFPATLPSPFLDYTINENQMSKIAQIPQSVEHRGGALWGGSIKVISNNMLKVSANYHLPIYVHGNGSFENKWWCGEVDITLQVNWNSSNLEDVPEQNFFSPIWFRRSHDTFSINAQNFLQLQGRSSNDAILQVSVDRAPLDPSSVPRFPILLHGQYNKKNTAFLWGGNITLLYPETLSTELPVMTQKIPEQVKNNILFEKDLHTSNLDPRIHEDTIGKVTKPKYKRLVVSAFVTSGTITGSYSAGPLLALWNGGFPATLPAPFLDYSMANDTPISSQSEPTTIEHRGGALWGGSIKILSSNTLKISANYHLPIYVHGNKSFEQNWWCGEVDIELQVNWNTTNIREIPEHNFFSPIWFRKLNKYSYRKSYISLQASETKASILKASVDRAPLDPKSVPRFPIMLHGVYNADNSAFSWDGNVTLLFPDYLPPEKPFLKATSNQNTVAFGGKVSSGKVLIDGGLDYWNGALPFEIQVPIESTFKDLLHGGNTVLSVSFDSSKPGKVSVKAIFSTPVLSKTDSLVWQSGTIESDIEVNWNMSSLQNLPKTSSTVYCLIYLRDSSSMLPMDFDDQFNLKISGIINEKLGAPSTMPQGLVILLGTFSTTNLFTWNGEVNFILYPATSKNLLTSSSHLNSKREKRLALGGTVSSGKITAFSNRMPKNIWFDGSLPVPIPMPAFDRFLPPGTSGNGAIPTGPIFHGHGILWRGNVDPRDGKRQIEIYGDFRMPIYEHGDTFSQDWFQGHVELVVDVEWNSANLMGAKIASPKDSDFFSPIRFRTDAYIPDYAYNYDNLQKLDSDMLQATPLLASSDNPYFPKAPMSKLPIILHGSMNRDRSAFLWSGNITMIFPMLLL